MKLKRSFYNRDADKVAKDLLGKTLVHVVHGKKRLARIVETEAYLGKRDLACHSAKGKTKRTEVMFGPPGHAYVYLIYGMYEMFNIVTSPKEDPQAVLIRALEPIENIKKACNGPGKLSMAMSFTRSHNGLDLCGERIYLLEGDAPKKIIKKPRIGVNYAGDWAHAPLRFYDEASEHISVR